LTLLPDSYGLVQKFPARETNCEVDPNWVRDARVVGITAGASAPEKLVEDVIEVLARLAPLDVSTMAGRPEHTSFRLPARLSEPQVKPAVL